MMVTSGETVTVEMAAPRVRRLRQDGPRRLGHGERLRVVVVEEEGEERRGATGGGDGVHDDGPDLRGGRDARRHPRVEIVDLMPRPNKDGKTYGSNAAAWWGSRRARTGRRHPVRRRRLHGHAGQQRRGDHDLRDHRGGRRGVRRAHVPVRLADAHRPRGLTATTTRTRACVPHDYMGFSETPQTMGWTKEAPISYTMNPYPAKIPINMHVGCMGLAPRRTTRSTRSPDADGRQPRRQADRQGDDDVLPRGGGGRAPLDGRRARRAGRRRARRHGDRDVDHRQVQDHGAQEGVVQPAVAADPRLPARRDEGHVDHPRLHVHRLPRGVRRQPGRRLLELGHRPCDAQRVHADAQVPDGDVLAHQPRPTRSSRRASTSA